MTTIQNTMDTQGFVAAIEGRDAETLAAAYAEDAVITIFDRDHPPAAPLILSGRQAIHTWYRDVCGRNIQHTVPLLVQDGGGFAFEQRCTYAEGGRVVCLAVAMVVDGLITRQTASQTWD